MKAFTHTINQDYKTCIGQLTKCALVSVISESGGRSKIRTGSLEVFVPSEILSPINGVEM